MPPHSSLFERFISKIEFTDTCWLWTAARFKTGYAEIAGDSTTGIRAMLYGHRVSYELFIGPIPDGLHVDHLCRIRHCVNPAHLETVTNRENARRGLKGVLCTHCPRGHAYDAANTYVHPIKGHRTCRQCRAMKMRKAYRLTQIGPPTSS